MTIYKLDFSVETNVSCFIDTNKGSKSGDLPTLSKDSVARIDKVIVPAIETMRNLLGVNGFNVSIPDVKFKQTYFTVSPNKIPLGSSVLNTDLNIDNTITEPLLMNLTDAINFVKQRPDYKIKLADISDNEITSVDVNRAYEVVLK